MKINRRQCREEALQMLYSLEFNEKDIDIILKESAIVRSDGIDFADFTVELIRKTLGSIKQCDSLIEEHSSNWSFDRIALVDKIILRLAITEFLHFDDIPPKVTINESLEIAKKFSTSKSSTFINGVLDSALKELKKSRIIYKN